MTHTVHLDRQGYVTEVYQDTRKTQLDERKFTGTLMEVTGPVTPGMRWDGQRFVTPPQRVKAEAVRAERDKRIEVHFPKGFRDQLMVFGGNNALKVSRYVTEVHRVAESMGDDAPQDYRDDKHWPRVPTLTDLPVPQRVVESISPSTGSPINLTVAPVINTHPVEAKPVPLEIVHRTVSDSVSPVSEGEFGLDIRDPLYALKLALFRTIEETVREVGPALPQDIRDEWEDELADIAALATAATSEHQIEAQGRRVASLPEVRHHEAISAGA